MAIKDVFKGFSYMLRAGRVIVTDFKLLRLAVLPMVINTVLFVIFMLSFNYFAYELSTNIFEESSQAWYWAILSTLLGIALFIVSIFVVFFGFVIAGLIIASPFNDALSYAVERKLTGQVAETQMNLWKTALFTIRNESRKMAVIVFIQITLFLMSFVPVVGQIIFVTITPVFMALVMAFEFTGYSLDRRGFHLKEKWAYIKGSMGIAIGFGLAVSVTLLIPIVNFTLLPLAVTGGTMLIIENPPVKEGETI